MKISPSFIISSPQRRTQNGTSMPRNIMKAVTRYSSARSRSPRSRISPRVEIAHEAPRPCLVAALLVGDGEVEGVPRRLPRLVELTRGHLPLGEIEHPQREVGVYAQDLAQVHAVSQQRQGLVEPPREGLGQTEEGGGKGPPYVEVLLAAGLQARLEIAEGAIEVTATEPHESSQRSRDRLAVGVSGAVGHAQGLVRAGIGGVEIAELGQGEGEPTARRHVGDGGLIGGGASGHG